MVRAIAIVFAVVFIMLVPIIWLALTSIRPPIEITSVRLNLLPKNPTLTNYFNGRNTPNTLSAIAANSFTPVNVASCAQPTAPPLP